MQLSIYIPSAATLIIAPGMDTLFVLNTAAGSGRRHGIIASAGISISILCHTLLAALGLAAIIKTSSIFYSIIQYTGAAYIIWLGISKFLAMRHAHGLQLNPKQQSALAALRSGFITNLLNPKIILFCLAFMPQFLAPDSTHYTREFLLLGGIYAALSMLWLTLLAALAGGRFTQILRSTKAGKILDSISGTVFIGMGIKAALTK